MKLGQSNLLPDELHEALRSIPKVELHRHLECSMRLSTFVELAKDLKIEIPATTDDLKEQFLVTTPMQDLESVLQKFMRTQAVLHSEEILARITFEAIEDAVQEGIRILELRWAPTFIAQGHPSLSFDKIIRAIRKGAAQAAHLPIAVGFLAIIQRTLPIPEADRVVDFAIDHKDFFLGLDLADNEQGFDPLLFQKAFEKARTQGLNITVHAGESPFAGSAQNVKNAIEVLGAQRIGHGVQIANDPTVLQFVRDQKVPLELCVTSNWLTQSVPTIESHPIRQLLHAGILTTINSDDPGVFDSNLLQEYVVLSKQLQFTDADFTRCNDIAASASFISLKEKQKQWPRPIEPTRS